MISKDLLANIYFNRNIPKGVWHLTQNQNNLTNILNSVNNDIQNLKMHTKDYSNWDDTYEFIEDENQEYIYTNFREGSNTLEQVDFDGIIYHTLNHKIIFSKFFICQTFRKPMGVVSYHSQNSRQAAL